MSVVRRAEKELANGLRFCELGQRALGSARRVMLDRAQQHAQQVRALLRSERSGRASELRVTALLIETSCLFESGEVDKALMLGASFGVIYASTAGASDFVVADTCRQLALFYNVLGDRDRASAFALECWRRCPADMRGPREMIALIEGLIALGKGHEAAKIFGLSDRQAPPGPPDVRDAVVVARARLGLGCSGADEIADAALGLVRGLHAEAWTDSLLFVANGLCVAGRGAAALELLRALRERLQESGGVSWLAARVDQAMAGLVARSGDLRAALDLALQAWAVHDELRYCTASQRLRSAVYESFAPAREVAISCAAELGEWLVLSELIEAGRLQSLPTSAGPTSLDRLMTFKDATPGLDAHHEGADLIVPAPFCYPLDDCWGELSRELRMPADIYVGGRSTLAEARTKIAPWLSYKPRERARIDAESVIRDIGLSPYLWCSTVVVGTRVIWSIIRSGADGPEGGSISLDANPNLSAAIAAFSRAYHLPTSLVGDVQVDAVASLRCFGSAEEEHLTSSLTALLPPQVVHHLSVGRSELYMLLSVAPELAGIPWPIVPLPGGARLVERCTLAFMPSLTSVPASFVQDRRPEEVPLLLACDCLASRAPERFPAPPRPARVSLGSAHLVNRHPNVALATVANVTTALRALRPGEQGMAFFRAHSARETDLPATEQVISAKELDKIGVRTARRDPSRSGIALADGVLSPILLSAVGADGCSPELPLPSHVIYSCCSSAGMADHSGGESLGLVAASFQAGASKIIATAVDVPSTAFTNTWDDRLITGLASGKSHFTVLREQQLNALREWRERTLGVCFGSHGQNQDDADSHPSIWAYYQAFGIE